MSAPNDIPWYETISDQTTKQRFTAKSVIALQGEETEKIGFILSGRAKAVSFSEDGEATWVGYFKENDFFGLGWEIIPDWYGEKILMHSGGDPGVRTLTLLNLQNKKGLIIFSNSDNGGYLLWEKTIIEPLLKD